MGTVLFDLDGTLTDSGPGIMRSVAYALDRLDAPPLTDAVLRRFVGPPLEDSFRLHAGLGGDDVHRAVIEYRVYLVEHGMSQNSVYDGIPEVLSALRRRGERLAVATSKPTALAAPILSPSQPSMPRETLRGMRTVPKDHRQRAVRTRTRPVGHRPR